MSFSTIIAASAARRRATWTRFFGDDKNLRLGLINNAILSIGSVQAAKVQQAVLRLHGPRVASEFHARMFGRRGQGDGASALAVVRDMGLDPKKVEESGDSPAVTARIDAAGEARGQPRNGNHSVLRHRRRRASGLAGQDRAARDRRQCAQMRSSRLRRVILSPRLARTRDQELHFEPCTRFRQGCSSRPPRYQRFVGRSRPRRTTIRPLFRRGTAARITSKFPASAAFRCRPARRCSNHRAAPSALAGMMTRPRRSPRSPLRRRRQSRPSKRARRPWRICSRGSKMPPTSRRRWPLAPKSGASSPTPRPRPSLC